jgi:hypoxanthine phosphoribosyltransferase
LVYPFLKKQISADYEGKTPLFLAILNGAFIFAADLVRACEGLESEIIFVKLQSYKGMSSSEEVTTVLGITQSLKGRHLIVVEDIVDTGRTLSRFLTDMEAEEPASIAIATFLEKPAAIIHPIDIAYCGFQIPNDFVVGYGLDYDGMGRNLKAIYKLAGNN